MKRVKTYTLVGVGAVLLLAVLIALLLLRQNTTFPFKCSGFTRYDLGRNGSVLDYHLAQDLRFQSANAGYFLLNGHVSTGDKDMTLSRTINLDKGGKLDQDTFRYHIKAVTASATDNTPEPLFNQLLSEFTTDSATLQLDVIQLGKQAYLIGGPISYLFTCVAY
ncbi:FidL-like protein [Brenneria corticis]|uniref:Uncharacterized protein n=1 Tax=Brenneria corticis TaxID=2173106 RepID=A0A2U1TR52_9GAMM|nr:FidL-like protein [Brenneria sp. CFCC 11842]PWC11890.1 hypothetical protein DDT56_18465 [Brenneria sp. CFCC 11842]